MSRYSVAVAKTSAATPGWVLELRSGPSRDLRVFEVGVTTDTGSATTIGLVRSASAGTTPGGVVVPQPEDLAGAAAAEAVVNTTYATAPTVNAVALRRYAMPAAVGSGILWSFPEGLVVPSSTFSAATSGLILWQFSSLTVGLSVYFVFES